MGTLYFCFGTVGAPRVDFGGGRRVFGEEGLKVSNFVGWCFDFIARISLASALNPRWQRGDANMVGIKFTFLSFDHLLSG